MRSLLAGCGVLVGFALFAEAAFGRQPPAQKPPAQASAPNREFWEARVKQVRVGMNRGEVEKLLPPLESEGYIYATTISGGAQVNSYFVAPGCEVHACYDYTGTPRNVDPIRRGYEHPQNRLLRPVGIQWHSFERKPTLVDPD